MNLQALESRFLSTCSSRWASVCRATGKPAIQVNGKGEVFALSDRPESSFDRTADFAQNDRAHVQGDGARFDFGKIQNVVNKAEQFLS